MHSPIPLPGDLVWIRQRRWRVARARRERNVLRLDVTRSDRQMTFLAPFDQARLAHGAASPVRVRPQQARARLAWAIASAYGMRSLSSAQRARVDVLPHQLEPALAMLHGARRVLIADDVGLGKTVQAGLAIGDLLAREPAARVLVCAPGALCDQWRRELAQRFGIQTLPADRRGVDLLAREGAFGDNPWRRPGVWLGSLDFLKQPQVFDALPLDPWDLLVVDEAHGACGESDRHAACSEIARRSRRVLLLTATPHSGDEDDFRRLLTLGQHRRDEARLTVFRRTRADVGLRHSRAVRWRRVTLSEPEARTLALLMGYEAAALRAAGADRREQALLLLSVFRKRALSTMGALVISLQRRLAWLGDPPACADWMQPRLTFDDGENEGAGDVAALMSDVGLDPRVERSRLRRLLASAEKGAAHESKAAWVARLLRRTSEPAVVFSEFRDSLQVVAQRIGTARTVSRLHGELTVGDRAGQLDRFLGGEASVLLATDVAGQGLNLQDRSRWVISLELPWNPARLEQRVGRVDRIGQRRRVHFTLAIARGDAESGLLARVARRVLAARLALGGTTLAAIAPDNAELAAALLEGGALEDGARPMPAVPICRRWARPARVVASRLVRSRTIAARWRGPAPARAAWCLARRHGGDGSVLVFSVPLVGGNGDVIERHAVAVHVAGARRSSFCGRPVIAMAERRAVSHMHARAVRLTRLRGLLLAGDVDADTTLARHLLNGGLGEIQGGLFDRRADRAAQAARDERQTLADALRVRSESRLAAVPVTVGRASLVVAFVRR